MKPATSEQYERVAGLFDIHYGRHDETLLKKALKVLEVVKPHRVIFGGDVGDNHLLSRWDEKRRSGMPQGKVARIVHKDLATMGDQVFGRVREVVGDDCVLDMIDGNHDERARQWLDDELDEGVAQYRSAAKLDEYGVNWHTRSGFLLRRDFLVRHGHFTVQHNAKREFDSAKCGGWSGHKHAYTMWDETMHETMRRWNWIVSPVLCRVDYDYGPGQSGKAPWPQGFLIGDFSTKDQYDYHTDVARYWRGKLLFRGQVF